MQQVFQPSWLVFLYQVPARPSSLRVKVWRRLIGVGAVQVRQSAYVLPNRDEAREDFEWIKSEVESAGGTVTLLAADTVGEAAADEIRASFRDARATDIAALRKRADGWLRQAAKRAGNLSPAAARSGGMLVSACQALRSITFFETPGSDELEQTLHLITERLTSRRQRRDANTNREPIDRSAFKGRRWVTRPRPGVDRMSSAWLIRRFIDPAATFEFSETPTDDAVPFDMYGAEFGHQGEACSFEVLVDRFGIDDEAARWMARLVHDIDLRVSLYNEPETAGLASMIEGLRLAHPVDDVLLEQGIALFETLAVGFRARRSAGEATNHESRQKNVSRSARRGRSGRRRSK